MDSVILNVRFGKHHLKIRKNPWQITFRKNDYWFFNKPKTWFKLYNLGSKSYWR
jgi:hypothetical protein